MKAYDCVQASRAKGRPTALSYIGAMIDGFVEMHGDRRFADDPAVVAGVGYLNGMPITVVGIEKGGDTADKVRRNFGSANPEGYRKALRQIKLAEKFHRPVLCLVDTSGAYCGVGAEERGQGEAIAENMYEMMTAKTPILSIVIGEGGSGGALALAVADEVWMLEDAYYSVISPEGAASILWKDAKRAKEAARACGSPHRTFTTSASLKTSFPPPRRGRRACRASNRRFPRHFRAARRWIRPHCLNSATANSAA